MGPATISTKAAGVYVNPAPVIAGEAITSAKQSAKTASTAAARAANTNNTTTTIERNVRPPTISAAATGVHMNAARSTVVPGAMAPPGSRSIARVRAKHEIISPACRRTRATEARPAGAPTSIAGGGTSLNAANQVDTVILHTQAKSALTGLGWKPAIAHAAVTAAAAATESDVTLEQLIRESLRQCPKPLGTTTIPGAARSEA
jgi:hypothetical protein